MKILQAGIASLLVITLTASLPGLYYQTESSAGSPSDQSPAGDVRRLDLPSLRDLSKPEPDPEDLPATPFSLQPLTGEDKEAAQRILRVDINTASKTRLESITGLADEIVNYRKKHGPIRSVSELEKIPNIGPVTANELAREILIDGRVPNVPEPTSESGRGAGLSIDINSAGKDELVKLNGIGSVTAGKIIQYRTEKGPIQTVDELESIDGIGPATLETLRNNTVP